jgi:ABC-type multidrug transport system permease subunit
LIALGRSTVDLGPTVAGPDPIVARSLRRLALAQFGLVGVLGLAVLCGLVRPYGATGEVWALLVLLRRRRLAAVVSRARFRSTMTTIIVAAVAILFGIMAITRRTSRFWRFPYRAAVASPRVGAWCGGG